MYSNPLEPYLHGKLKNFNSIFEKYYSEELPGGHTRQFFNGSNCYRGYQAFWTIKNDSLKLVKIKPCCDCIPLTDIEIIDKIFDSKKEYADWFTGTLIVPKGKLFSDSYKGYNVIHEYEERIQIKNGIVFETHQYSNLDLIKQYKLDKNLYTQIPNLKDTLLFQLNRNMDWEKYCDCWDNFLLSYDTSGNLIEVSLIKFVDDSITIWDKIYYWRFDKKCSKKIFKAIQPFSLTFLNPHRSFTIEIDLFYGNELKMRKCEHYFEGLSDLEIEQFTGGRKDIRK